MEKIVIGLLFIIACLSLLICGLIRIIVELINGSNRKPHKSHVTIMCAALCGDYRNVDGDYNGGAYGMKAEYFHQQSPQFQQMADHGQGQGQGQYQQQQVTSKPQMKYEQKAAADPLADDLRITFSDVRMTEYPDNLGRSGGKSLTQKYSGVFDDDSDEEQGGGVYRPTDTQHDPDTSPPRASSVFFKAPSFVRPSSVRRPSHAPPPTSGNNSPPPPNPLPPVSGAVTTSSFVFSSGNDLLNAPAQKRASTGATTGGGGGVGGKAVRMKRMSTTDYGLDEGVEEVDLDHLDDFNPSLSQVTDPLPGSISHTNGEGTTTSHCTNTVLKSDTSKTGGEAFGLQYSSYCLGNDIVQSEVTNFDDQKPTTTSSSGHGVGEGGGSGGNVSTKSPPTATTYAMSDTNHESRLSMATEDSLFLETEQYEADIRRLQKEIEEIERQELAGKESVGGGDKASSARHETELERLRAEMAELDNEMRSSIASASRQRPHHEGGSLGLCDENYSEGGAGSEEKSYMQSQDRTTGSSGNTSEGKGGGLSFFNVFSKNKNKKGKSTYEGAYNEGISVTGVSKQYHVDTSYANTSQREHDSYDRHMDQAPLVDQHVHSQHDPDPQGQEEWPTQVVRKKSSMTSVGGGDRPKRQVTFHKSISSPTMSRQQVGHVDDFVDECHYVPEYGGDASGEVRPLKKSQSLHSNIRPSSGAMSTTSANTSSSGRRQKVSSNSRAARKSNSKSPPRRQASGEAEWNSYKGGQGVSRPGSKLKVGKSQSVRLSEANQLKGAHGGDEGLQLHKPENITYQEKR